MIVIQEKIYVMKAIFWKKQKKKLKKKLHLQIAAFILVKES